MSRTSERLFLRPIGRVEKDVIRIRRRWAPGLQGIEGFSHLIVLFWLHRARRPELRIHPRDLKTLPRIGFLATRTPHRPSPVGMTVVALVKRRGCRLWVKGLDAWEGTPVLDVKPYTKRESIRKFKVPGWVRLLDKREADPLRRYGGT